MIRRAAIVGVAGGSLTAAERALLRDHPPLGVVLFRRNVGADGPAPLVAALRLLLGPGAILMVDQEGGRVARLRPPRFAAHPPAASFGALAAVSAARAERAAFLTGALIGLDCASVGIDVATAPVLDLAVPGADDVIGDRAFSADPDVVAGLGGALARGVLAAGVMPVGKHVPGHGRARADSHVRLPVLDDLDADDLRPFAALRTLLPWLMTAHVLFRAVDPERPATLSATLLGGTVRDRIGFDGVLVSDDLAMGALHPNGAADPGALAAAALAAGCDVALHCSGVLADTERVLATVPPLGATALRRIAHARTRAAAARRPLDRAALLVERDALLGASACTPSPS